MNKANPKQEWIKWLDSLGLSYFPFSRDKKPIVKWTQFRNRKPTEKEKKAWIDSKSAAVFSAITGDVITALDIDAEEIYTKFFSDVNTLTIKTPSGGYHLIFQSTGEDLQQKWGGWDVDILGKNGNCKMIGEGYVISKDLPIAKIDSIAKLLENRLPKAHRTHSSSAREYKSQISVEQIIEHYGGKIVQAGKNKLCNCLFHNDKNPSALVNKDNFYCFVCQKSWDIFAIVEEKEGVDFRGSIKKLQEITGKEYVRQETKKKNGERDPLKNQIFELAKESAVSFFQDQHGEVFATLKFDGHLENHSTRSREFMSWLSTMTYDELDEVPGNDALKAVVNLLNSIAFHNGEIKEISNRVAFHKGGLWYDLTNTRWDAVRIDEEGWKVIKDPPTLFRRYKHQNEQVIPDEQNADVRLFYKYVNLKTEEDKLMSLICLIYSYIPELPKPVVIAHGPHGSSKSTFARACKRLVDPSSCEMINPKKIDELPQAFAHQYLPFVDNISYIGEELSDMLCKAATGASFQKRALFTDDEDVMYSFVRQTYLTGISPTASKPDLLDRSILLELEPIPDDKRKEEKVFWREFEQDRPRILGGIFNALSRAMKIEKELVLPRLQRLADFTRWGEAISRAIGYPDNAFINAYQMKVDTALIESFEANQIAYLLMDFTAGFSEGDEWTGTMKQLREKLLRRLMEQESAEGPELRYGNQQHHEHDAGIEDIMRKSRLREFPRTESVLSRRINSLKGSLLKVGIVVENLREGKERVRNIRIRKMSVLSSAPSAIASEPLSEADGDRKSVV